MGTRQRARPPGIWRRSSGESWRTLCRSSSRLSFIAGPLTVVGEKDVLRAACEGSRWHARGFELREVAAADEGGVALATLPFGPEFVAGPEEGLADFGAVLELGLQLPTWSARGTGDSSARGRPWR